jgi:hypothetical protein
MFAVNAFLAVAWSFSYLHSNAFAAIMGEFSVGLLVGDFSYILLSMVIGTVETVSLLTGFFFAMEVSRQLRPFAAH